MDWHDEHKKGIESKTKQDESDDDPNVKPIDTTFNAYDRIDLNSVMDSMTRHGSGMADDVINVERLERKINKVIFETNWLEKVAYENFVNSGAAKLITSVEVPHHASNQELHEMAKPWLLRQYIVRMDDKHMSVYEIPDEYRQSKLAGVKYEI